MERHVRAGVILFANLSAPAGSVLSVTPVSNDLQLMLSPTQIFGMANYPAGYVWDYSQGAFMPRDESGRYFYFGSPRLSKFLIKADLFNNSQLVFDANWPAADLCVDPVTSTPLHFVSVTANETHFFISCATGVDSFIYTMSRTNTNIRERIYDGYGQGQVGHMTVDDQYLYFPKTNGTTIGRFNFKTGALESSWTTLPSFGNYDVYSGAWRVRLYRENQVPVLWVSTYPRNYIATSQYECLHRIDLTTGQHLSVVWNDTALCQPGLNDFFIAPNGVISYVGQPYTSLPPVAAPELPPVAAPELPPSNSPTSTSEPVEVKAPVGTASAVAVSMRMLLLSAVFLAIVVFIGM